MSELFSMRLSLCPQQCSSNTNIRHKPQDFVLARFPHHHWPNHSRSSSRNYHSIRTVSPLLADSSTRNPLPSRPQSQIAHHYQSLTVPNQLKKASIPSASPSFKDRVFSRPLAQSQIRSRAPSITASCAPCLHDPHPSPHHDPPVRARPARA
jgi:hypothetical protein